MGAVLLDLKLVEELERKAKRHKLELKIQVLEGYRGNVRQALERLEEAKSTYREGHSKYAGSWLGETRQAYEEIAAELNAVGSKASFTGGDLVQAINQEIRKLQDQADALR